VTERVAAEYYSCFKEYRAGGKVPLMPVILTTPTQEAEIKRIKVQKPARVNSSRDPILKKIINHKKG
jgi:hypothetical protein